MITGLYYSYRPQQSYQIPCAHQANPLYEKLSLVQQWHFAASFNNPYASASKPEDRREHLRRRREHLFLPLLEICFPFLNKS